MGGLQITVITELLDREGKVIPKLYAAGEMTGGVHGGHRLGGCTVTDCVVMERVAGKSAAAGKARHRRITLKCRAGAEKALPFMNIPQNIPSCRRGCTRCRDKGGMRSPSSPFKIHRLIGGVIRFASKRIQWSARSRASRSASTLTNK